jgi:DNA-binding PadR family transcriptional regulator
MDIVGSMAGRRLTGPAVQILLALGGGERHGYGIMVEVAEATGDGVRLGPGTLYTTLARLEADGLIEESDARPDPEVDDQRRRYWRLTTSGRAVAIEEVRRMEGLVARARGWSS